MATACFMTQARWGDTLDADIERFGEEVVSDALAATPVVDTQVPTATSHVMISDATMTVATGGEMKGAAAGPAFSQDWGEPAKPDERHGGTSPQSDPVTLAATGGDFPNPGEIRAMSEAARQAYPGSYSHSHPQPHPAAHPHVYPHGQSHGHPNGQSHGRYHGNPHVQAAGEPGYPGGTCRRHAMVTITIGVAMSQGKGRTDEKPCIPRTPPITGMSLSPAIRPFPILP